MREGYYVKRDSMTGTVLAVGQVERREEILHLERWDGAEWVDWPALLDATGIGGSESWFLVSEAEASRAMKESQE